MLKIILTVLFIALATVKSAPTSAESSVDASADSSVSASTSLFMRGNVEHGVEKAQKPPRMQVVASSSGFKTGVNGTNAFDEFSVNNGQCTFKNNKIIENGVERPASGAEISEVADFKSKLEEFGKKMQARMSEYMVALMHNGFKEPNKSQNVENWPMAPEAPCFCVKCPTGGIKFVHPQ